MQDLKYEVNPSLWVSYLKSEMNVSGEMSMANLLTMSGSSDASVKAQALQLLGEKWNVLKNIDANGEKVIIKDLLEEFESFPKEVRDMMIVNLLALEITRGCNGGCYFCMYGEKKGITHKYTYESIVRFFEKYGEQINKESTLRPYLYLNSDPLDYKDGDKRFIDIYKVVLTKCPCMVETVSTSLPPGTEKDLVDLVTLLADNFFTNRWTSPTRLRISLAAHNIKRVEAVLKLIETRLEEKTGSKEIARSVLWSILDVSPRAEDMGMQHVGALRNRTDVFSDVGSPVCQDGVVISPDATRSVAMISATMLEPSGQVDLPIHGTADIILRDTLFASYLRLSEGKETRLLTELIARGGVMMQDIVLESGQVLGRINKENIPGAETREIYLSRAILSLYYGIGTLDQGVNSKIKSPELKQLFQIIDTDFQHRSLEVDSQIKMAKSIQMSSGEKERYDYLIELWDVYKTKFILVLASWDMITSGESSDKLIRGIMLILDKIDRSNFEKLEDMVGQIIDWDKKTQSESKIDEKYIVNFLEMFNKKYHEKLERKLKMIFC